MLPDRAGFNLVEPPLEEADVNYIVRLFVLAFKVYKLLRVLTGTPGGSPCCCLIGQGSPWNGKKLKTYCAIIGPYAIFLSTAKSTQGEKLRAGGKPCCCLIVQSPDRKRRQWKLYMHLCTPLPAFYAYKLQRVPPTGESPVAA